MREIFEQYHIYYFSNYIYGRLLEHITDYNFPSIAHYNDQLKNEFSINPDYYKYEFTNLIFNHLPHSIFILEVP